MAYMPGKKWGTRRPRISEGYWMEWCWERKRYVYQHRLIIERELGRFLDRKEIVHHLDEDKLNNERSNLEHLPSISAHNRIHHSNGRSPNKGRPKPWLLKPRVPCPICGTPFKPHPRKTCSQSCGQTLRYQR